MRFHQAFHGALTATVMAGLAAPALRAQTETRIVPRTEARTFVYRMGGEAGTGAALGLTTSMTHSKRDTLGLLVNSITAGGPAEKAGIEEGNRLQAINGVTLRVAAADVEDYESASTLQRRLTRELAKAKPGDEVELRVYREGRTNTVRVKTVAAESLFKRTWLGSRSRDELRKELDDRPAIGITLGSSGSRRDTLGVLVMGVADSSPASRAGLEEGNRIAAINGVNLRVAREDVGDDWAGNVKASRLRREISQLKVGDEVTLHVYANGTFRDVKLKAVRAGDLPRHGNTMIFGNIGMLPMPPMPPMHAMPAVPPVPPIPPSDDWVDEIGPQVERAIEQARMRLQQLQPQIERSVRRATEGAFRVTAI